jgi:hypothetical protein
MNWASPAHYRTRIEEGQASCRGARGVLNVSLIVSERPLAQHVPHDAAAQHNTAPTAPPLAAREFWRMLAPWFGYAFLALAGVLGLFTASGTADSATYASGMATFALAAVLVAWKLRRQFDGGEPGFLLPTVADNPDLLLVTIALLTVLGIVGAVLAATVGGTIYRIGLALFLVCAAFIFIEIKRYFDRADNP